MSRVYSSDVTHSVIFETTYGQTPTSGTRYQLPLSSDQAPLTAEATQIKDNTLYPNRAAGGSQRGMISTSGSLNQRMIVAPVMDHLFENALSGTFNSGVLAAGVADSSFTLLTQFGTAGQKSYTGLMVKGFTIDAKANEAVNVDWSVIGTGYNANATPSTLTVTATTAAHSMQGSDVLNVVVAGSALAYSEISFATTLDRTQSAVLGSNVGIQPGVNGARSTTVTVKAYRDSMLIDTLLTGGPQAFAFDIGTTGAGYHFNVAGMIFSVPTDELNNGSAFVNIKGEAKYDATLNTDMSITKL